METGIIDLSPLLDELVALITAALSGLAVVIVQWVRREASKRGIEIEQAHAAALHNALRRGINWGVNQARLAARPLERLETRSQVIAEAVNYAARFTPDAIAYFNLTPSDVERLVVTRLGDPDNAFPTQLLDAPPDDTVTAPQPAQS